MHLPLTAKMDAVQAILASTAERATRDVTSMANAFFANADQEQRGHFVKQVRKLTNLSTFLKSPITKDSNIQIDQSQKLKHLNKPMITER